MMSVIYRAWIAGRVRDVSAWQQGLIADCLHGFREGHSSEDVWGQMSNIRDKGNPSNVISVSCRCRNLQNKARDSMDIRGCPIHVHAFSGFQTADCGSMVATSDP